MRKRILFVYIRKFHDYPILYEYCTGLQARGFEVSYVSVTDGGSDFVDASGVQVLNIERGELRSLLDLGLKFRTIAKRINPDLIHVFHFRWCVVFPIFTGFFTRFLLDLRTVHIAGKSGKHSFFSPIKNLLTWGESIFYDQYIALTEETKRILSPSRRKIVVIPLGASTTKFRPPLDVGAGKKFRDDLGIDRDRMVFLYSGTLSVMRRIDLLIEAFGKFSLKFNMAHLIIMGHDKDNPGTISSLKDLAESLGLTRCISFTGFVPYNNMIRYFHAADIGLCYVPQEVYYDQQPPTKLFEYMAAGLVAIGTKTTAISEILQDTVNGFLSKDDPESFAACMHNVATRYWSDKEKIIESASRTVEKYSWDNIIDNHLLEYYESFGIKPPASR